MAEPAAPGHDIVVIGASMGGIEAVRRLLAQLPSGLPASLFVVQHVSADSPGFLPEILQQHSALPVQRAGQEGPFAPGRVYVAAPNLHLLLRDGRTRLVFGPRENGFRPAVDPLFRSAAASHGPRTVGIILSGLMDDGASGLEAVHRCGGLALVQDPADAEHPEMPQAALEAVGSARSLPLAEMGAELVRLVGTPSGPPVPVPEDILMELRALEGAPWETDPEPGTLTELICPECGGPLWSLSAVPPRYRCRVGHAYTGRALLRDQKLTVEGVSWTLLRALQGRRKALAALIERAAGAGREREAAGYRKALERTEGMLHHAQEVLRLLERRE